VKFKDYYETLGIDRKASQDEIQKAFRKLARKYQRIGKPIGFL
jgi:curved DNA-binding protein